MCGIGEDIKRNLEARKPLSIGAPYCGCMSESSVAMGAGPEIVKVCGLIAQSHCVDGFPRNSLSSFLSASRHFLGVVHLCGALVRIMVWARRSHASK